MAVQLSSFTKSTARDRVKGDLGQRATNLITDADIDAWIYEATKLIAKETHWLRKQGTAINVVSGTALYDLPTDLLALEEVWHNSLRIFPVSVRQIEKWHATENWRALTGTPTRFYVRGMTAIGLYLTPDTSITGGLVLHYSYFPTAPATDSDFYTVPTVLDRSILTYGKWMGAKKDASGELRQRAQDYKLEWEQDLQDIRALVGDVSENELVVMGEDQDPMDGEGSFDPVYYASYP